jgi:hypothetical protein
MSDNTTQDPATVKADPSTDNLEKKISIVETALSFLLQMFLGVRSIFKSGK